MPELTHVTLIIPLTALAVAGVFAVVIAAKKIRQIKIDFSKRQLEMNFEEHRQKNTLTDKIAEKNR